ncbi:YkoP family protein [Bacillus sp. T33-2]|uniref:YkoP family protein n=1 Tax=Bacillus sp. T33-2 TaxID=2054168 RepID=UPI000C79233D|nr:hypothetical protein [Bacillus sp. T33-2]PLR98776.1 hypothetical protein CVD19_03820 [Bacillus sp. T33-2]
MFFRLSLLSFWRVVDPVYYFLTRLKYIETEQSGKAVFRVRLTKYKGADVVLSDGTCIFHNDVLLKIHLHNVRLLREMQKTENQVKKAKVIIRKVVESMPLLADYINTHPEKDRIKGVVGITLLNKGYSKLGFESHEPKNSLYRTMKHLTQIPIYCLSASSFSFERIKKQKPVYLMMSKEKLISTYLTAGKLASNSH